MTKSIQQMEPWIGKEEREEILLVLRSGWITEAKKTAEFEKQIKEFVGAGYVSVVSSGTVALFAGLASLGVGKGDEVIVPDFTMVASPNSVILTGAKPVFVDIERESLCLDLGEVEKKITPRTKAIMPVAMNGRSPDMEVLLRLGKKYKLFIIEDAAQALGCYFKGKHLGTFGDVGILSFSTPKIITTAQGGAVMTDSKRLYEKVIQIKDFGRLDRRTQDHDAIGYNFKFTDILAAIGVTQMKKLPGRLKRKKEMYQLYKDCLADVSQVAFLDTDVAQTAPWFIDIIVPDPIGLQKHLKARNIGTRLFFPAIHTTKPYRSVGKFPNSLWAATYGLWLPSSSFLSDTDIQRVCLEIKKFYGKN